MKDGRNFFDQPINSMSKTYGNIRKIATGKGDDYTRSLMITWCFIKNRITTDKKCNRSIS